MKLKNTLNEDYLYCKDYVSVKEIDEQKFCLAYLDEKHTLPRLVNMAYWKPQERKTQGKVC